MYFIRHSSPYCNRSNHKQDKRYVFSMLLSGTLPLFSVDLSPGKQHNRLDHCLTFQGQLFHFCPIHWNGEVEDNLPDPVAIRLLFGEQLDPLDKLPHELFPLPLGSGFIGIIERQQQTTDHVRNKGAKVVC